MVKDTRDVNIYVLQDPGTLEVRYVGKTVRALSRRLGNHIANAKGNKHNKHLSNWILKLLSEEKRPIIKLIEVCSYKNWQDREKYWISKYPNLINLTDGGDGCQGFIHDEITKEKCRKAQLGKRHTDEFKMKMSLRLKGKPLSEEHKLKIGNANRGRKASLETRKKLSEAHRGYHPTEEATRNRSIAVKKWWAKRKLEKQDI